MLQGGGAHGDGVHGNFGTFYVPPSNDLQNQQVPVMKMQQRVYIQYKSLRPALFDCLFEVNFV